MYKLAKMGLKGRLFKWIQMYLKDRTFQTRIGNSYSSTYGVGAGVPQGAVLSPSLFNIMLCDMPEENNISIYSFADDITISMSGKTVSSIRIAMQKYLDKLVNWLERWGMVVSPTKSSMQVFTKSRNKDIILKIHQRVLPINKTQRILGIEFDAPSLTYNNHIKKLQLDIRKRIDMMKCLSSTNWGASQKVLKMFYQAYVRGKMDYGSVLYDTAAQSHLKKLDVLQNKALRLISGGRRSSPITSLEATTSIPPLKLRRSFLCCKYFLKLLHRSQEDETVRVLGVKSGGPHTGVEVIKTFMQDIHSKMRTFGFDSWTRSPPVHHAIPPWTEMNIDTRTSLMNDNVIPHNIQFKALVELQYDGYYQIYTDGSKLSNPESTACALYDPQMNTVKTWKLQPDHTVLASEIFAIIKSLKYIEVLNNICSY